MDNPQIRFSHNYPKLWRQKKAELLAVRVVKPEQFNYALCEYDMKTGDGTYYPIDTSKPHLQLIFLGDHLIPFCTLRPWTPQKAQYYNGLKGSTFDIVITGA